jgi:predicted amidophosphoribosyltransferase
MALTDELDGMCHNCGSDVPKGGVVKYCTTCVTESDKVGLSVGLVDSTYYDRLLDDMHAMSGM